MPKLPRPDWYAVLALIGLSAALWAPRLAGPIDLRWDAGVYYILGTSLAEGKGYRLLNEPGEIRAVQYPPLLPALVAVHQELLGTSDPARVGQWLRWTFFLIYTGTVVAAYAMARGLLRPAYALCAGALTALYSHNIFISELLFTEIPFTLVTLLFVIGNRRSGPALFSLPTALAGWAAYLLRTAGIALLVAWVGDSLCHRRWKQAVVRAGVAAIPVVAWQGYLVWVTSGEEYRHPAYEYQRAAYQLYNVTYLENMTLIDSFRPELGRLSWTDVPVRVLTNLATIPHTFGEGASTGDYFWGGALKRGQELLGFEASLPWSVPGCLVKLLGCVVLVGIGLLARRGEWFLVLYVAGLTAAMCLTPWPEQFSRYVIPLTPFLALALVLLLWRFREFTARHWPGRLKPVGLITYVAALTVILLADAHGARNLLRERSRRRAGLMYYDRGWGDYDAALAWLKGRVGPGEVIATWAPYRTFLQTGRQAVMPPMEGDSARAQQLLDSVPAAYLVVDDVILPDMSNRYTKALVNRNRDRWQEVYASADGKIRVFRRKHGTPGRRSEPAEPSGAGGRGRAGA